MAPIIAAAASAEEVAALSVEAALNGKSLEGRQATVGDDGAGAVAAEAEGRDDGDGASANSRDGGPLDPIQTNIGERASNLFAEEDNDASGWGLRAQDVPSLSLMPSSSPTSTVATATPSSLAGMEDVHLGTYRYEESQWIKSQIDADEALARQLQKEENAKPKPKAKANVVPSFLDSLLGEPLPSEVKSSYTKVKRGGSGSSADELSESISSSISSAFGSFKKWGSDVTAAANEFFGEDVQMQVRRSSSARKPNGQYRNAV